MIHSYVLDSSIVNDYRIDYIRVIRRIFLCDRDVYFAIKCMLYAKTAGIKHAR